MEYRVKAETRATDPLHGVDPRRRTALRGSPVGACGVGSSFRAGRPAGGAVPAALRGEVELSGLQTQRTETEVEGDAAPRPAHPCRDRTGAADRFFADH